MKQFLSFLRKEFYHIFRDMRTTCIMLAIPVVLIVVFGYAISMEIKNAPFAVFDQSKDEVTTNITNRIAASEYFRFYDSVNSNEELQTLFRKGKIKVAVVFPANFGSSPLFSEVQILADASAPNEATALTQYASAIIKTEIATLMAPTGIPAQGITPVVQLLYNPQMKDAYNFVPGVMGMILILICSMMTSVGIVREKEFGSMEVLLVSPMKPIYIILAKATPYLLVSFVNIVTILLLAHYLLGVPIVGSLTLVLFLSTLYALVALCLGLLISTVAESQQSAMLISAMALLLPIMLLSGMMFPIENMPPLLQLLSNVVPARWYIVAIRDVMIKGAGWTSVMTEIGILLFMTVVLIAASVKRFKVRLE
jgi:ABC-type multidrug transport system, permease component